MSESAPSDDRINGWKEIAAHFDRSVRAVQRWERELGLPVHRIATARGSTVYALRSELREWMERVDTFDGPVQDLPGTPQVDTARPLFSEHLRVVLLAALVLVVAAGAWAAFWPRPTSYVARVTVTGQALQAFDARDRLLWAHPLEFPGFAYSSADNRPNPLLIDVDRDGIDEVIVGLRGGASPKELSRSDALLCFSSNGRLLWMWSLEQIPFTFDGQSFDGPTQFLSWAGDQEGAVWLAVAHNTLWPTVLVKVNATGGGDIRYVQSGYISVVRPWIGDGGRRYVLAGGVNNEHRLASLAIIDADRPFAVSPQTAGAGFHCDQCAAGAPASAFMFPRSELGRMSRTVPYSFVTHLTVTGTRIRLDVYEENLRHSYLHYALNPDMTIEMLPPSDAYASTHRLFEADGLLDHRFEQCPDLGTLDDISVWRPDSGWSTLNTR